MSGKKEIPKGYYELAKGLMDDDITLEQIEKALGFVKIRSNGSKLNTQEFNLSRR